MANERPPQVVAVEALATAWTVHSLYPDPDAQPAFRRAIEALIEVVEPDMTIEVEGPRFLFEGDDVETEREGAERLARRCFVHHVESIRFEAAPTTIDVAKLFAALLNEHRDNMPQEQQSLVERVENSLVAVEDLLGALLDISRLDTSAPVPKPEVFPISDIFKTIETQFSAAFADDGLKLRFAKSSLYIRSDPALLRRIVQNFVSNARRYTPAGGVLVGCRRRGDQVAIQVVDTGIGIAREDQRIVFDEFKRLGKRGKATKRGLGLGLAIVDRIAKLLDHEIRMRSEIDRGSTFEVLVPLADPSLVRAGRPDVSHLTSRMVLPICTVSP